MRSVSLVAVALATCVLAAGCDKQSSATEAAPVVVPVGGEARIVANEHGYTPSSLTLTKGGAGSTATLTFERTSDHTCATEVVFPELKVTKDLPLNKPVSVQVPTDTARTLTFQCGMAMYKGALVVK
jgi:plastocyanin domain-containing protein